MRFAIWAEGYAVTGNQSGAMCFGNAEGDTFEHACKALFAERADRDYYDPHRNTYWGCKLFDNETDARKSFG